MAGFGRTIEATRVVTGLRRAAVALNAGDLPSAMMAALHLGLPEIDAETASRIASVNASLAKYDPNEPRDWHGRWTTDGADSMPTEDGYAVHAGNAATSALRSHERDGLPSTTQIATEVSPSNEVTPESIEDAAYNGRYHDEVVLAEAERLRKTGEVVLTEVRVQMADGSAGARLDILAFDPRTYFIYGVEVKTGDRPAFTPGQIIVYPHLMLGESVVATDPRVIQLGLLPNFPLWPIPMFLLRQRDRFSLAGRWLINPEKMSRYYMGKVAMFAGTIALSEKG